MKITITRKNYTDQEEQTIEVVNEKLRQAQEAWNAAGRARPFVKADEVEAWNQLLEAEKVYYQLLRELGA